MDRQVPFPYEVALFDFDGLLVDTEPVHYSAYKTMCKEHGVFFSWDFSEFCKRAHSQAHGVFVALAKEHPEIFQEGMTKEALYKRKTEIYEALLQTTSLPLMEGAKEVLQWMQEHNILRAVVTNSPRRQINWIKDKLPILQTIPLFITREDYTVPKPSPEGYLLAKERLGALHKKGIGFEDARKGVEALLQAGLDAAWVGKVAGAQKFKEGESVQYWASLKEFFTVFHIH